MTRKFDSVQFCLSKGLGAPVGSMIVGSRDFIERCRPIRKMLGGGMRQAGVLAAAGLVALEDGPKRLQVDHDNAQVLARELARNPGIALDPAKVQTNIVIFSVKPSGLSSADFLAQIAARGVLAVPVDADRVRMVTHLDVNRADIEKAAEIVTTLHAAKPIRIRGVRRLVLLACAFLVCGTGARARTSVDLATHSRRPRRSNPAVLRSLHQHHLHRDRSHAGLRSSTSRRPAGRARPLRAERGAKSPVERPMPSFASSGRFNPSTGAPRGRTSVPGCTDPKTGTPEPLGFLLASNQNRYRFTIADAGGGPPGARAIDFIETPPQRVRIKWEGNCFEADGGGQQGRVWFDPDTYDVLQVEVRLSKPFLIPLPDGFLGIQPAIRVEKSEMTLRFSRVEFQQPDEALMLPASIETLHVLRGVPSLRIRQTLANYRRFLTKAEIRDQRPLEMARALALMFGAWSVCTKT